jgi:hypothetical protein
MGTRTSETPDRAGHSTNLSRLSISAFNITILAFPSLGMSQLRLHIELGAEYHLFCIIFSPDWSTKEGSCPRSATFLLVHNHNQSSCMFTSTHITQDLEFRRSRLRIKNRSLGKFCTVQQDTIITNQHYKHNICTNTPRPPYAPRQYPPFIASTLYFITQLRLDPFREMTPEMDDWRFY